jgi:glucose/arabinose dehydrogenase
MRRIILTVLASIIFSGLPIHKTTAAFAVEKVAFGLNRPVFATSPIGDVDHLFIVEQHTGRIQLLDLSMGQFSPQPLLDLGFVGSLRSQEGILGMAFHPDFASNGYFYVNFTLNSQSVIQRYQVFQNNPNVADPLSAHKVLTINQPRFDHNSGWLGFGTDGFLYIASGDGGGANDPDNNGQNINSLLGKILRIDVDSDDFGSDPNRNYAIPSDNPFVGQDGSDEIWAYGLRNPWRPSFDRATADLYIADVGQDTREEINRQLATSTGGENYGWDLREGTIGTLPPNGVDPIYEYGHGTGETQGFSITGGYVYRGSIEELQGKYFFADFVTNQIWSIQSDGSGYTNWTDIFSATGADIGSISSFGEDADGNLYIIDMFDGELYRISPFGLFTGDINGDGILNVADLLLATRIALGLLAPTADQLMRADVAPIVNGVAAPDGTVNAADVLLIQRIVLGF